MTDQPTSCRAHAEAILRRTGLDARVLEATRISGDLYAAFARCDGDYVVFTIDGKRFRNSDLYPHWRGHAAREAYLRRAERLAAGPFA